MAVVMKQQDRAEEAIEAIKSFRDRCSKQAQESLDNVLIDLYKSLTLVEDMDSSLLIWFCSCGNMGWTYMQQTNYAAAEIVYHKAQQIDPDANKACNLCPCLLKLARFNEAETVLEDILQGKLPGSDDPKLKSRAIELLNELEPLESFKFASHNSAQLILEDAFIEDLDQLMNQRRYWKSMVNAMEANPSFASSTAPRFSTAGGSTHANHIPPKSKFVS
ncbi:hypothetical protein RND71_008192 [Anisodus tanguticus]|uniref:Uncharacterized protein n=1 Tax=Anisodus tanguticus TaxID=243964 RepID=A0AAE1SKC4_9SOLA|nr:hypothetical protein RND71_008192 [Anisodus tanguticus]